ncbi:MAG: M48 family metallopeptidase [Acidobacteria bacterium]|nr:M48 family metallopeptidase [Acidobacteriota bacterium]
MDEKISQIKTFYEAAFRKFDPAKTVPEIDVCFYPYIGINHTIRVRDGVVFVRLAELCDAMPESGHRALAEILVAKLLRKKVPALARETYSRFVKQTEIRERAVENKRNFGRKIVTAARGEFFDLDEIFEKLNAVYFRKSLPKPVLSWSARKTYRILGHHDGTHETIVVSRSLDDRSVPEYVVEYIVYHEMLHIFHPTVHHNGRRSIHTPEFRRSERRFADYEKAERWIEQNIKHIKRRAKKTNGQS